ncbi:hypothetical protein ACJW88_13040 [Plesiomonas shigelloides]|uniref:hypothetical protein n=1 Tax=Plesiomonas shigelloides TaxID=703 RepID=UPI001262512D|nr:hypothetical protein [Plesiomonas shigelloides]KAB7656126.1 hypothetical protein GBN14_08805 [Plesiomonas shigelloides]
MTVSSRLLSACFATSRSVTFYRRTLWRVLLMSAGLSASASGWVSSVWASESSNVIRLEDMLTEEGLAALRQEQALAKEKAATKTASKSLVPIQSQGPEHAVKLSANGQSLLLRTIPPVTGETANALASSGESAPEQSQSAASAGIAAGMEESALEELNAMLDELLPTAWLYGDKLSAFQGGRWQQSNRSIPLTGFTYANLNQIFFSQNGQVLALTAGSHGSLDALRMNAEGHRQKLIPDDMARFSAVTAMDATGATIGGWLLAKSATAVPQGFIWHQERGLTVLPPEHVLPQAISADGTEVIVDAYVADRALLHRHHQFGHLPADLPGSQGGGAFAISQDGKKAAGYTYGKSDYVRGWIWDATHGYHPAARALYISNADTENPEKWQAFGNQLTRLAGLSETDQHSQLKTRLLRRDAAGQTETVADDGWFLVYAPLSKALVWQAWSEEQGPIPMLSRTGQTAVPVPKPDGVKPQDLGIIELSSDGQSLLSGNAERQIVTRGKRQIAIPDEVFGNTLVMSADGRILAGTYPDEQWSNPDHIFWLDVDSGKRRYFASCSAASGVRQNVMLNEKGDELIVTDEDGGYCRYHIGTNIIGANIKDAQ